MLVAEQTLTAAQINASNTTPVQIVAAPGAGKAIVPIAIVTKLNYAGTPFSTASALYLLAGTSSVGPYWTIMQNAQLAGSADAETNTDASDWGGGHFDPASRENQPVTIAVNIATSGGTGATIQVSLAYWIANL
jgi:hypothetical protein